MKKQRIILFFGKLGIQLPIFLMVGGVLIIINLRKRKVIIDQQRILCINLFSKKELTFGAIKGCRVGEKAITLEPLSPADPSIIIGNYSDFSNSGQLAEWLKGKFNDLDAMDLEEDRKTVLQGQAGFTDFVILSTGRCFTNVL